MKARRAASFFSVVAAAAPLAISTPDSSVTSFRIGGGSGSYGYITRGCNGDVLTANRVELDNVGADVSHKFTAPFRVGVRAGIIQPKSADLDVRYVNPYLSQEGSIWSAGLGLVVSDRRLPDGGDDDYQDGTHTTGSGHLRVGKKFYWSASYLEDVPIAIGGYAQTGVGMRGKRLHVWGGVGALPQDGIGFVGKADARVMKGFSVGFIGRLGSSEGIQENGFALSLSYDWVHRRDASTTSARDPGESIVEPVPATGSPVDSAGTH